MVNTKRWPAATRSKGRYRTGLGILPNPGQLLLRDIDRRRFQSFAVDGHSRCVLRQPVEDAETGLDLAHEQLAAVAQGVAKATHDCTAALLVEIQDDVATKDKVHGPGVGRQRRVD